MWQFLEVRFHGEGDLLCEWMLIGIVRGKV